MEVEVFPKLEVATFSSTNAKVKKGKVIYKLENVDSFNYCSWPPVTSFKDGQDFCLSPPQKLM